MNDGGRQLKIAEQGFSFRPGFLFLGSVVIFFTIFGMYTLPYWVEAIGYESYLIPSESMSPTLTKGDYILTKMRGLENNEDDIQRGDIIVFTFLSPENSEEDLNEDCVFDLRTRELVKRVIGLPGDIIQAKKGELLINGLLVERRDDNIEALPGGQMRMKVNELKFPNSFFDSKTPYLIGVRHHSAAMSFAIPKLLDAYNPDVIFIELPIEFKDWIVWVQHEGTQPPIALVSANTNTEYSFYPFAEFSPEWATIRWAGEKGISVIPIDISVDLPGSDSGGIFENMGLGAFGDRAVECHVEGSDPEDIRRAGLRVGWALRSTSERSERDLARETWMRKTISEYTNTHRVQRPVAVIGSFHAAALLPSPLCFEEIVVDPPKQTPTVSLVRYTHALLDERSGYPAGVLDPEWHMSVLNALQNSKPINEIVEAFAVALCREVQIGGGTNIGKAMQFVETLVRVPQRSIVLVLSDFEEGFSQQRMVDSARRMHQAGMKILGLASLDDSGTGRYDVQAAKALVKVGMPVAALSPNALAHWIKEQTT